MTKDQALLEGLKACIQNIRADIDRLDEQLLKSQMPHARHVLEVQINAYLKSLLPLEALIKSYDEWSMWE